MDNSVSSSFATIGIGILIAFLFGILNESLLNKTYVFSILFGLGVIVYNFNIKNYETRDDSLNLFALLNLSVALGFFALLFFSNSEFFGDKHQFHTVLSLIFLLAVPSALINTGSMLVSVSN
jgi:hypothetical protein